MVLAITPVQIFGSAMIVRMDELVGQGVVDFFLRR
jgi:hypothetical protein